MGENDINAYIRIIGVKINQHGGIDDADAQEAVEAGLELLGGFLINVARIAEAQATMADVARRWAGDKPR